jgi:hypothetical protein
LVAAFVRRLNQSTRAVRDVQAGAGSIFEIEGLGPKARRGESRRGTRQCVRHVPWVRLEVRLVPAGQLAM